jgi:hypothetical protein
MLVGLLEPAWTPQQVTFRQRDGSIEIGENLRRDSEGVALVKVLRHWKVKLTGVSEIDWCNVGNKYDLPANFLLP